MTLHNLGEKDLVTAQQVTQLVVKASEAKVKRNFVQSYELTISLSGIDMRKRDFNINETVYLPNKISPQPTICVFAAGDLAVRARKSGADRVIEPEELDTLATDKRSAKKIVKSYIFFLADTTLMPKIGKILGQYLGPKGKMPTPLPPNAPIESMIERLRSAVRIRGRNQLSLSCRIGDEKMSPQQVAENALSVIAAVEKKLPLGSRNIKDVIIKLTMSAPSRLRDVEG